MSDFWKDYEPEPTRPAPVQQKPLFADIIAQHPGLAEELKAMDAAPVQEPDHSDELTIAYMSGVHRGKELAAQRQWVGLSPADRGECLSAGDAHGWIGVMEATEAKLKEKNT
jgi:hypothetical protein